MSDFNKTVSGVQFTNFHNDIYESGSVTINPYSTWVTNGAASFYTFDVNQGLSNPQGILTNNGVITTSFSADINTEVLGRGTFKFYPWHDGNSHETINGFSGFGQTYDVYDDNAPIGTELTINQPRGFFSSINLLPNYSGNPAVNPIDPTAVTLKNLPDPVTSYDFRNDLLTLYNGNRVVDTLRLQDQTPHPIYVEPGTNNSVSISFVQHSDDLPVHSLLST